MELKRLGYFIAVAEDLSFSQAARRLGVSQPIISRGIKELEAYLGTKLFHRTTAGVKLTKAGRILLPKAEEALLILDEAILAARTMARQREDNFDIGYLSACLRSFLGDALDVFSQAFPTVNVKAHEMNPARQLDALRDGKIDIGFIGHTCPELGNEFDTFAIYDAPLCLILSARHPWAKKDMIKLSDMPDPEVVVLSPDSFPGRRKVVLDACYEAGFKPEIHSEVDSLLSVMSAVATSQAFSLIPKEAAALATRHVRAIELEEPRPSITFDALVKPEESRKMILTFLRECRRVAQLIS